MDTKMIILISKLMECRKEEIAHLYKVFIESKPESQWTTDEKNRVSQWIDEQNIISNFFEHEWLY